MVLWDFGVSETRLDRSSSVSKTIPGSLAPFAVPTSLISRTSLSQSIGVAHVLHDVKILRPAKWLTCPVILVRNLLRRLPHPHCESAVLKGPLQAWKQQLCLPIVGPTVASFCHRRLTFGDKTAPANVGADGRHMNLTEEAIYQICPISPCCVNPHLATRNHSCDVTRAAELRLSPSVRVSQSELSRSVSLAEKHIFGVPLEYSPTTTFSLVGFNRGTEENNPIKPNERNQTEQREERHLKLVGHHAMLRFSTCLDKPQYI
ncbi:conserved hypothetical protein [Coccidioides posadasii str. Silveira]|uniref:Uncharacterized protein n=1 Tax=Coccidioides posadasii (strain RMSCC 757 / Silveira) TaxID=443226 RepID=E9DAW6_COCPS|nr:conserved hypothetical protein [Coccidioides posadasii str. Silveira]